MSRKHYPGEVISFAEAERLIAERRYEELAFTSIEGLDPGEDAPNEHRTNVSRMKAQKVRSAINGGFTDLHPD